MSKKLAKSDVNVQSIEQMVEGMKHGFQAVWNELADKPEAQAALLTVWEQVQQLRNANIDLMALLQGSKAALDEVMKQRNRTLDELEFMEKHGLELSQKRLAGFIAVTCKLPLPDAERIVAVIMGEKSTSENLGELREVLVKLGNLLYAEEKFSEYGGE